MGDPHRKPPPNRAPQPCALCRASGRQRDDSSQVCEACGGAGQVLVAEPARTCHQCFGTGVRHGTCIACNGTGWQNARQRQKQ